MSRKDTRPASVLRGIAPFIAVLTVLIALAALAQTRGEGQASGKSDVVLVSPSVSATLVTQERRVLPGGINAVRSSADPTRGSRLVGPLAPVPPIFSQPATYASGGTVIYSVAVADVNGDGKPDLVVANGNLDNGDGSVGVLLGNGDGTFQPVVTYDSGAAVADFVVIADVNGDGKPDIVVANAGADNGADGSAGVLLGKW